MYSHTSSCLAVGSGDSSEEARKALVGLAVSSGFSPLLMS